MQFISSYRPITVALLLLALVACGKRSNAPTSNPKKDSAASKDSGSVRDSLHSSGDSTTLSSDSTHGKNDTASAMNDSARVADSLKAHPAPVLSYEQRQGKYVYATYCAVCHGEEGKADGFNTYNLDPKPRDLTEPHYLSEFSDERLVEIIREGGRGSGKSPSMPPYGWTLGKNDISYVASFLRTFMPPDTTKPAPKS